jgi:hypothetical protein
MTQTHEGSAHKRPPGVPAEAVFVGGEDGGVYLVCAAHERAPGLYRCTVYADFDGSVEEEGVFALLPPGGAAFDPRDASSFTGWSEGSIYLRDGRTLEAQPNLDVTR